MLASGEAVTAPLWVSHWSSGAPLDAEVRAGWYGEPPSTTALTAAPWDNTPLQVPLTAPASPGEQVLVVNGVRVAANRLLVAVE